MRVQLTGSILLVLVFQRAFSLIELTLRKVIHVHVTRSPTDLWVAQQLREATPYGQTPTYLIRDNDRKFGPNFARVATTSGSRCFERRIVRHEQMLSVSAFWEA